MNCHPETFDTTLPFGRRLVFALDDIDRLRTELSAVRAERDVWRGKAHKWLADAEQTIAKWTHDCKAAEAELAAARADGQFAAKTLTDVLNVIHFSDPPTRRQWQDIQDMARQLRDALAAKEKA